MYEMNYLLKGKEKKISINSNNFNIAKNIIEKLFKDKGIEIVNIMEVKNERKTNRRNK